MAEEKQKRMTRQKRVVYEVLASTKSHPTADWIYQQARREVPDISLGTIYRNLQVLLTEQRIRELNYGKGQSRFDANSTPHYHFVCEQCGRVIDFPEGGQGQLLSPKLLEQAPGQVYNYRLECYGLCNDCLGDIKAAK